MGYFKLEITLFNGYTTGIVMHSLKSKFLNDLSFTATQLATLRQIGESRGKQALYYAQAPEVLKSLQQVASIESSESSNRLEGITVPHKRIEDLVLKNTKPLDRSEQELAGYRDGLALLHESSKDIPFSIGVVLQLHKTLYRYLPSEGGKWKMTNNEIVEKNRDGSIKRVRFKATPAHLTPDAIETLISEYHRVIQTGKQDPLIAIPLTILDFLCIHPFRDGNGRIARLLTLQLLYHHDYQVGRYISLERIFEESKKSYYETLEASSQQWHDGTHNVFPWLDYFWGVLIRAYREFEERVGKIKSGTRGWKSVQVRQAVERQLGPFAISDIEAQCRGVSRDTIRMALRQLRDSKEIFRVGKGRGSKWVKNR